jgi:YVTN family beta-propeller protein
MSILTLVMSFQPALSLAQDPVRLPTVETKLKLHKTIGGAIAPKSVRASNNGLVAAFNMMYRHTITVYDAKSGNLIKTIQDSVNLRDFGYDISGTHKGAPVEGAFSPDGNYLYSSNYSMYGPKLFREGTDSCGSDKGIDKSFIYRINLDTLEIDNAIRVGAVPKIVEVTPDNKYVLVTNWCSYTLSVISVEKQKVVKTIYIGRFPRGIAVTPDSSTAYVAEMGSSNVHKVDLTTFKKSKFTVGSGPRHLVLSPDARYLYVSLNAAGKVAKYDLLGEEKTLFVATGTYPRTMTISSDGTALYIVNYGSGTLSKVRTSTMKRIQNLYACPKPIGVAFETVHQRTWVACYGGAIKVYKNKLPKGLLNPSPSPTESISPNPSN